LGQNGNFGFHQGFNLVLPIPVFHYHPLCNQLAAQFGMRFVQSNFYGDQTAGAFRDSGRYQSFMTAGLFRRADEWCPVNLGVVIDWMRDDYYYPQEAELSQIRFEVSGFSCWGSELGLAFSFSGRDEDIVFIDNNERVFGLQATDTYTVFLRRPLENFGEWRIWGGPTGNGDGLLGAEFWLPVSDSVALEGGFNYLFADERDAHGQTEDAYALGLSLVWYPACRARCAASARYRPLLGVAGNGRFFVDRK
jgi:hypothetical protein